MVEVTVTASKNQQTEPSFGDGKFIACVPWGEWVAILVHRSPWRRIGYIRLRRWNKHRTKGVWYPTRTRFVVRAESADALADALRAAAKGEPLSEEPDWLREFNEDYVQYKARKAAEADNPPPDAD